MQRKFITEIDIENSVQETCVSDVLKGLLPDMPQALRRFNQHPLLIAILPEPA